MGVSLPKPARPKDTALSGKEIASIALLPMALQLNNPNQVKPQPLGLMIFLLLLAVGLGWFYRFPDLGLRPMHVDEAILGVKFLEFWQSGIFNYDPSDYHGPVLHYLTLGYGRLMGWTDPAAVTGEHLRLVVAVLGMALVLSTLLVSDALGRFATGMTALLIALSPMEVFYSRYFIMEVPFVLALALFMFSCWRYAVGRSWLWLAVAGIMIGTLHATKETFVINLAAMACGWGAARLFSEGFSQRRSAGMFRGKHPSAGILGQPWMWIAIFAVITSVGLFSGGFRFGNPVAWLDVQESVLTYGSYLKRSGGVGHEKPWAYYLEMMAYHRDVFVWTEAMILGLAVLGVLTAFLGKFQKEGPRQAFLIFLAVYALAATAAYSIIPYKTPWTFLSVQHAYILLAGVGAQSLLAWSTWRLWKVLCTGLFISGLWNLCLQNKFTTNDRGRANLRAPYVYSQTTDSAVKLVRRLRDLAELKPGEFAVQVINKDSGWPLPWYLRDLKNIGYQQAVPETLDVPVIVVDAEMAPDAHAKLAGKAYESDFFGVRPGVNVVLMVKKDWWDELQKKISATAP